MTCSRRSRWVSFLFSGHSIQGFARGHIKSHDEAQNPGPSHLFVPIFLLFITIEERLVRCASLSGVSTVNHSTTLNLRTLDGERQLLISVLPKDIIALWCSKAAGFKSLLNSSYLLLLRENKIGRSLASLFFSLLYVTEGHVTLWSRSTVLNIIISYPVIRCALQCPHYGLQ